MSSSPRSPFPPPPPTESKLKELQATAQALNAVSDELTKQVSDIEAVVNSLNLGITANVVASRSSYADDERQDVVRLAYERTGGKWGFVIEQYTDAPHWDQFRNYKCWPFKDAPRELRAVAVERIPDLFTELVTNAQKVAEKLTKTANFARELASRIVTRNSGKPVR